MKIVKVIPVSIVAILVFAAAISTNAKTADLSKLFDDDKIEEYSKKASAIIFAPSLTRGTLLQLRGSFGSASFSRKAADGTWCDAAPIRILFGDFDGETIDVSNTGAAILMILNTDLADKLARGQDVTGDDVTLLDIDRIPSTGLIGIDVLVSGSASANSGMILNPGRNFLDDIFGASSTDNSCGHKNARAALAAYETE